MELGVLVDGPRLIIAKPISWEWSLVVWVYALAWFFVNNRVKLIVYRIFQPTTSVVPARP